MAYLLSVAVKETSKKNLMNLNENEYIHVDVENTVEYFEKFFYTFYERTKQETYEIKMIPLPFYQEIITE